MIKDAQRLCFLYYCLNQQQRGPTAIAVTATDATCGAANGSFTLGVVTGGVAPYTYSVDASLYCTTTVYNNLAASSHTIDVKDANGCIFSTTASISNSDGPTAIAATALIAAAAQPTDQSPWAPSPEALLLILIR